MPPIHNHYVPAYYLSGFANCETGKIFMYRKDTGEVVETTVGRVANQLQYWSPEVEKFLANAVEGPANLVLDKIKHRQPIDNIEKWLLSRYIITMIKRVPEGRDRIMFRAPQVIKETVD